jgi:hypothetical protein
MNRRLRRNRGRLLLGILIGVLFLSIATPVTANLGLQASLTTLPGTPAFTTITTVPLPWLDSKKLYCQYQLAVRAVGSSYALEPAYQIYGDLLVQQGWRPFGGHESTFSYLRGINEWAEVSQGVDPDLVFVDDAAYLRSKQLHTSIITIKVAFIIPSIRLCSGAG